MSGFRRLNSPLMNPSSLNLVFPLSAEGILALDSCLPAKLSFNTATFSYERMMHYPALVRSHPILVSRLCEVN